jgi:hypothetical protein
MSEGDLEFHPYLCELRLAPREVAARNTVSIAVRILTPAEAYSQYWIAQVLGHSYRCGPATWVLICPRAIAPTQSDLESLIRNDVAEHVHARFALAPDPPVSLRPFLHAAGWLLT